MSEHHLTDRSEPEDSKEPPVLLESKVTSITLLGSLLDEMTQRSQRAIPREAIGLLGGKEFRTQELLITKILFVTEGDEVSVAFSEDDFSAFEQLLEKDLYCVGWWHSHPGYGLFLSHTDISTHIYSFQLHQPLSVAMVIEPTQIESNGRAAFQCYQVVGHQDNTPFHAQEIASYITEVVP
jgi:proteasome lid subunit RPN8/RPN11